MRSCIACLTILFVLTGGLFCTSAKAQQPSDAYLTRTFNIAQPELIDVSTSGGFVRIHGSDRDDVRVEMYVRRNNRYLHESNTEMDDFDIEVVQEGSTVKVHSRRRPGFRNLFGGNSNVSVSFIVYTPGNTNVESRTSGGSMLSENLTGHIRMQTSGGSVTLDRIDGDVLARTSGGGISISNSSGDIDARTSGGSITVESTDGRLNVHTSGGSIRMNEIGGAVQARTSGGSITAELHSVVDQVDLSTSGGSITIQVPSGRGYNLDLRGTNVRTELRNFTGDVERNRVMGTINNGGPLLKASTSGGSVRIDYM